MKEKKKKDDNNNNEIPIEDVGLCVLSKIGRKWPIVVVHAQSWCDDGLEQEHNQIS